jgi:hypothetical protein
MRDMNVGVLMVLSSDPGSTPGISTISIEIKKGLINQAPAVLPAITSSPCASAPVLASPH